MTHTILWYTSYAMFNKDIKLWFNHLYDAFKLYMIRTIVNLKHFALSTIVKMGVCATHVKLFGLMPLFATTPSISFSFSLASYVNVFPLKKHHVTFG